MSGVDVVADGLEVSVESTAPRGTPEDAPARHWWRGHPVAGVIALTYLVCLTLVALLAPWIAPYPPNLVHLYNTFQPPAWGPHPLGTDELGRDELSRLMYGARVSLEAAVIGTGVAVVIGVPAGLLAGYVGGWIESVGNFVFDALMSMPGIIFAMVVIAVVGPGLENAMVTIGIVISPVFFRLGRAATNNIKNDTYIEASIAIGCTRRRTLWRHVLPNMLTPIVTLCAVIAGSCIVAEASLSFLGLGVRPPTASWGAMLTTAQHNIFQGQYLIYFPGIAVLLTVLACSLLGDWLREALGTTRRSSDS
jgi:peptide/nickel transport system permease protein